MNEKPDKQVKEKRKEEKEPDFEAALAELESLVDRLEKGEMSLDESLKQFKRGVELTRRCQKILDEAQQVVEQLTDNEDESSSVPVDRAD